MTVAVLDADRDTRELILSTAAKLFGERGFANVSIRDICDGAGVTPPTIYHHFGNKDQLFQEVIRSRLSLQGFRETLISAVQAYTDPQQRLRAFILHYLTSFPRDFFNPGMFLQDSTHIYGISYERVSTELGTIEQLAQQIIEEGIIAGNFRPLDLNLANLYLMNLLMSYVLGEVHYHQSYNLQETAVFIHDIFVNGIRS
jgi:TetR/AcrR family fatty acid metabolism transcriptional regulator